MLNRNSTLLRLPLARIYRRVRLLPRYLGLISPRDRRRVNIWVQDIVFLQVYRTWRNQKQCQKYKCRQWLLWTHTSSAPAIHPSTQVPSLSYQGNWWDIHSAITDDIIQIYQGVQHCLDLRRKYIRASLQRSSDNPKNNLDHWKLYPPPPPPRWTYNAETNTWQDHKQDIPKVDVGHDFDINDCEIPGPDPKIYKLEAGVYQVFPDQQCMFSPLAWKWP